MVPCWVVRRGGEEILLYLENLQHPEVDSYATMLLSVIGSKPIKTKAGKITATTSMGIVRPPFTCANIPLSPEEAVNIADAALYKAKSSGRNRAISIADQQVDTADIKEVIERDFEEALAKGYIHIETITGPLVAINSPSVINRAA